MNNDGSGCLWAMLLSLVLVVVVGIAVADTGLPTWNGTLAWDTTATADRQATERLRIAEEGRAERERIAADAETSTQWAITLRWLGVAAAVAVGVWAWSKRPHKPVPPTVLALLSCLPVDDAYRIEEVNGEYRFVSDVRNDWMTVDDAHRLTG